MNNLSVTALIKNYHCFDRDFWLSYKALEAVTPKEEWDKIKMNLLRAKRVETKYILPYKESFEEERTRLDLEWKFKSETEKQQGTDIHNAIHKLFCTSDSCLTTDFQIPLEEYSVMQTDKFLQSSKGLFSEFRIEVPITEEYSVVGIADLIIKDGNHIKIIDYKTADKIDFKSHYDFGQKKNKMMKYPLSKLMDANGVHYQLQLSIYAWMLQQINPEFVIDDLEIVQVKDMKVKKRISVEYLKDLVPKFIDWHIRQMKTKNALNDCVGIEY